MLNGIGGRTIEEAKERMSLAEFQQWSQYYQRRGTISAPRKLEWGFALVASLLSSLGGGKKSIADFMPYLEDPDEELTIEKAMETWK